MTDAAMEFGTANRAMIVERARGYAVRARYDRWRGRVIIGFNSDIEHTFLVSHMPGLAGAPLGALRDIEISPSGLGLHWPRLDVDLYIPTLVQGDCGSAREMVETQQRRATG